MAVEKAPEVLDPVFWDDPSTPIKFSFDQLTDNVAASLVNDTLDQYEMWRTINCDRRWEALDRLYVGAMRMKTWPGSNVPRAAFPVMIAFDQIESAYAALSRDLLGGDELFNISPEGKTHPIDAAQVRDRLNYIIDHNLDDYGWTARMEMKLPIKDQLLYGNCFGIIEWDGEREQATIARLDPRDVYTDPYTPAPWIDKARASIVHKQFTIDEINGMREFPKFRIPDKLVLLWLANNRQALPADQTKGLSEAARGVKYTPGADDRVPFPADKLLDVYIYFGGGREIWLLGRGKQSLVIYNELFPYKCNRLVSAPCFTYPNRFYAQSYADVLEPIQNMMSGIVNAHLDWMSLILDPMKSAKRGVPGRNGQATNRPGAIHLYEDPTKDVQIHEPTPIPPNIWNIMSFLKEQAESRTGRSSMSVSGLPNPSNANRTRGGVMAQLQAPTERLAEIANNFSDYFLVPALYKMLKVEREHSASGPRYGQAPLISSGSNY